VEEPAGDRRRKTDIIEGGLICSPCELAPQFVKEEYTPTKALGALTGRTKHNQKERKAY